MMFDIVAIISKHRSFLEDQLKQLNPNQIKAISKAFIRFYFLLPETAACAAHHLKIKIEENQLLTHLENDTLQYFKEALKKYDLETDEYADEFVELEPLEVNILSGIENCVYSLEKPQNVISNFLLIIDILDYYENFSEKSEQWNKLLEEEVQFQKEITERIVHGEIPEENSYYERYKNVSFDEI